MLSVMPFHNPSCYLRKVINWSRPVSEYFSSHYLFIRLSSIPGGGPAVIPGNTKSVNLTLGEHPSMASLGSQGVRRRPQHNYRFENGSFARCYCPLRIPRI